MAWRAMVLVPLVAAAFTPHDDRSRLCKPKICGFASSPLVVLSLSNQAENHSSDEGRGMNFDALTNLTKKDKRTVARAGGRRPRTDQKTKQPEATKKRIPEKDLFSLIRDFALPLCLLSVILRFLFGMFGGSAGNPHVFYYSRSVYESTTYTKDGNIERTRRENFQSNIPELVEQDKEYTQEQNGGGVGKSYFNTVDGEFEDKIDSLLFGKW